MGVTNFDIVDASGGFKVDGTEVITSDGAVTADIQATAGSIGTTELADDSITPAKAGSGLLRMQYVINKPETGSTVVVDTEDISGGAVAEATVVRSILDYPRNLLYTLTDASGDTLEADFTVTGTDQFGNSATETVSVNYDASATTAGTQIFATIDTVAISNVANEAASDTASVGVAITADVASFGLPHSISAVTDVISVNWIDAGTSKTQNIDSTSVVVARDCFRPEQNVVAADDYIIMYEPS